MTPQSTGLSFHTHNRVMGSSLPSDRNTKSVDTMADMNIPANDAPAEQAPTIAPPTRTDDQILPSSK
ncbi:hypothetical protein Tco_0214137 [Tanacetum coccineum]